MKFEVEEMKKSVEMFNDVYHEDLCYLSISDLVCEDDGRVDCSEISILDCLMEAFSALAKRPSSGYKLSYNGDDCSLRLIAE
jgi:hypothetical protein